MDAVDNMKIQEGLSQGESPFELNAKGLTGAIEPDVLNKV